MHENVYSTPAAGMNIKIKYHHAPAVLTDVCVFSSFSFSGIIEEYVYYYLQELQKAGFSIAFISTSIVHENCVSRLSEYAFLIIERENTCPDFGSWKAGLSMLNWGKNLNSVLLVNDSVFGPFYDIGEIISSMKNKFDAWGMTENYEIGYHLQSYFLYFNKKVVDSDVFSQFWQQVNLTAAKQEVIQLYEVGLSALMLNNGFSVGAYCNTDILGDLEHLHNNHTVLNWNILIEKYHFPFLKRELFIRMQIAKSYWTINVYINTAGWKKIITANTNYPVKYIEQFLYNYQAVQQSKGNTLVLKKRSILFLSHSAADTEGQRLLINFLQWLKAETDIGAEILICNRSNGETENELAGLGIVTHLYALTAGGKQYLKQRLAEETAMLFSFTIENIAVQKFLAAIGTPQLNFIHEPPDILNECLSPDNAKWLLQNVQHFIASNHGIQENLITAGMPTEKIDLLHPFINPAVAQPVETAIAATLIQGVPPLAFVAGICGDVQNEKIKGLLPVIAAALCGCNNDIYLVWLGAPESGLEQVHADLMRAGLTERVHFVSSNACWRSYMPAFDVFIMVSLSAGLPLAYLESGMAGKPVISFSASPGVDEYTGFGTGDSIPFLNIGKLSEKVMGYYNDRQNAYKENNRIRGIVNEKFSTRVVAPEILRLMQRFYDATELTLRDEPVVTFFTHIYYENSWYEIKNKLKNFDNGRNHFLFSISDACLIKYQIIEDIKKSFENVHFIITSNIGKDIGGKMALIDIYLLLDIQSSFIVFLHDKQSPHSLQGQSWKNGLFKIIDHNNQQMIINHFSDPAIGIVGSKDHIVNEYDAGTGKFVNNSQFSKKLMLQFDINIDNYDFLGGTMYWMRSSVIKKFFSKNNPISMRENLEAGNVMDLQGERMAHTWERMFSWMATNEGLAIKGI